MTETVLMTGKEASLVAKELTKEGVSFEALFLGNDEWEFTITEENLPFVLRVVG